MTLEQVRVLYIEDNEGAARLLEKRLSRAGFIIDIALDGEAGLEQWARQSYDVIIVDYNLPDLSGLQVLQQLSGQGSIPPTIMLTGTGNERIAVEALKLGAFDYVIKDIDGVYLDLLPTVIEQALKNQQLLEDKLRAEEALRESEERFRMLFEEAPDPYFVNDLAGNLLDCNRAVEPLLGMSMDVLIGKHYSEMSLFAPDQLQKIARFLAEMSDGVDVHPVELIVTRPDGQEIVIDLRMLPIQAKGQTQILSVGHDITWRKQAELQMKAHIERLETLRRIDEALTRELDIHYAQAMALDSMMRLSGANAGSIALIGEAQILGIYSIGYPEELNQNYSMDKRSIVTRVMGRREAEWVKDVSTDPDYFNVLDDTCSQITLPLVSQERLVGIVNLETNQPDCFNAELFEFLRLIAMRIAVAIDNAQLYNTSQTQYVELQNLYEKVSQLEQLKTDMIRLAAHDLSNLLSSIMAQTYLLRKTLEDPSPERQQNRIDAIDSAVTQMKTLITEFLSIERIEGASLGERPGQVIDFQDLVQQVFANYQVQAEEKAQHYHFSSPEIPLVVRGYEAELQQVIANLIGNAIKYTPEGGSIEVSVQAQDNQVRFEVTDTGYGIPDDQQARLFQPFYRVQMDETKSIEGTGLGLYLVKKFIERNRGEIIFYSEQGKGSTFGFSLSLVL